MNINLIDLLFGFEGRINRAKYWLAVGIWLCIWLVFGLLVLAIGPTTPVIILGVLIAIPSIWSGIAVGIKRLHDREMSGWWLVLFYLVPPLLDLVGSRAGMFSFVFSVASLAITIWAIVVLGCLRGTIGMNRYGPDPVAPRPASH